jgi:hypothetical protein
MYGYDMRDESIQNCSEESIHLEDQDEVGRNIKMNIIEMHCRAGGWIDVAQGSVQ